MRLPIGHQINSNLDPILPHFRYIAGFLLSDLTPYLHPNFRGVPIGPELPLGVLEHSSSCCCSNPMREHYYCVYLYMMSRLMY